MFAAGGGKEEEDAMVCWRLTCVGAGACGWLEAAPSTMKNLAQLGLSDILEKHRYLRFSRIYK